MDVPELLHPHYLLGSASYCTCTTAQILTEKIVKNQQAIDRLYLYLVEIKKWYESCIYMIKAMVHGYHVYAL